MTVRLVQLMVLFAALILGHPLRAADDPTGNKSADSAATNDGNAGHADTQAADADRPDKWRYRWHNGRWWYWTKSSRWLVWNAGQGWVLHEQPVAPVVAVPQAQPPATRRPADDSWRWGWDPANPFDRHPPGRPMNSPKVFPRNM